MVVREKIKTESALSFLLGADRMYEKTQRLIKDKLSQGVYSGVVYELITESEKTVQVFGNMATVPQVEPMVKDALFDVASLTKVVCTTTVVLKLWEAGKLDLDLPLNTYLPEFVNREITLRHLLTHTSDIQTWIENRDQLSPTQLQEAYMLLAPGENLGKEVKYTDAGTLLLGFMLEKIYQQPVVAIFQQEVLKPLGMKDSLFLPTDSKKIVPTEQQPDGTVLRGVTHDPKARILGAHAGNAGLFTNQADLEKFVMMYLNQGESNGRPFLQRATIQMLLQDQTPDGGGQRSLGWDLKFAKEDKRPLLFHTGYTGTFLLMDILKKRALIFLSNRVHPKDHRAAYLKERDEIIEEYLKENSF